MKKIILALVLSAGMFGINTANADFGISLRLADFSPTPIFNNVTRMEFDLIFNGGLIAGKTYNTSDLVSIDYTIQGALASPTPSGFPGFLLERGLLTGAEFDALSPDSSVNFAISAAANLSDGLQITELVGGAPMFLINARELNQNPGRFHPPIFELNADGSGRLYNANNMSTFPNPQTPNPVDVQIEEEYHISLQAIDQNLTLAVPEPGSVTMLAGVFGAMALRRRRKK